MVSWLLKLIAIAAPIGAVAYVGVLAVAELNDRTALRAAEEATREIAARRALAASPLVFKQLVVGPGATPTEMRFRARARSTAADGEWTAAYGVIDNGCSGGDGCWRLAALYVDGEATDSAAADRTAEAIAAEAMAAKLAANRAADPAPGPVRPVATTAIAARAAAGAATAPSRATPPQPPATPEPATAPETTTAPEVAAAPEPAPAPSHAVRLPLVNARAAPTTSSEVLARLPGETSLLLLESQGGWGRFLVLDGESRDREVWVAFSVLRAS